MTLLLGTAVPLALLLCGAYFAVMLARHLRPCLHRGRSGSARALAVALAGTLGVGNIAGVASAIALGGAGAVFWMWVAALLAMPLKYAEIVLAVRHRRRDADGTPHGGAPYYIKEAFGGRVGRGAAVLFAALCALCALTLGGMLQANAAAEALSAAFRVPPVAVGAAMALLALAVLVGGGRRVERVCTALVPLMCLFFAVAAVAVLILRRGALPDALGAIFRSALTPRAGAGGAVGVIASKALRYGVTRGLVSNEAGCGTAPIAHSAAEVKSPAEQGLWGILEVFVDTILLCTLTALVILASGVPLEAGEGVSLAISAFRAVLGDVAEPLLALSVALFAFATVLCWAHYGVESLGYLLGQRRAKRLLLPAVAAAVVGGAVCAPGLVWNATDLVLGLMTLLNLTALLLLRGSVRAETRAFSGRGEVNLQNVNRIDKRS
ncbi:MAG: alanine:cation symporter family protein [Ruminococcaceae bacterium]|nr:alanine:cation symporter family protein [Oscillospiraceae bacterium]